MARKRESQQPALDADMLRPVFGGLQYRPMDTGKGGWDLFRPTSQPQGSQPSLLDLIEEGYKASEYGDCGDLIDER